MSENEDKTLKEESPEKKKKKKKKKSKTFKMIEIEEWNNFVDVITFLYKEHEKNQVTIKDLYIKIEEIKNVQQNS